MAGKIAADRLLGLALIVRVEATVHHARRFRARASQIASALEGRTGFAASSPVSFWKGLHFLFWQGNLIQSADDLPTRTILRELLIRKYCVS